MGAGTQNNGTTTALRVPALPCPDTDWGLGTVGPCASGERGATAEARFPPTSDGRDNRRYLGRGRGLLHHCLHATSHVNQWWILCMKDFTPILVIFEENKSNSFQFRNDWVVFSCWLAMLCEGPWLWWSPPHADCNLFVKTSGRQL